MNGYDAPTRSRHHQSAHRGASSLRSRSLENLHGVNGHYQGDRGHKRARKSGAILEDDSFIYYKSDEGRVHRIRREDPRKARSSLTRSNPALHELSNRPRNQVYFEDDVRFNGNESLASIHNVRIPSGAVSVVRASNGDLLYFDANKKLMDVQAPKRSLKREAKTRYGTRFDDSADLTLMDSGYNTTTHNNSSKYASSRGGKMRKSRSSTLYNANEFDLHEDRVYEAPSPAYHRLQMANGANPYLSVNETYIPSSVGNIYMAPGSNPYRTRPVQSSINGVYPQQHHQPPQSQPYPLSVIDSNVINGYPLSHTSQQQTAQYPLKYATKQAEYAMRHNGVNQPPIVQPPVRAPGSVQPDVFGVYSPPVAPVPSAGFMQANAIPAGVYRAPNVVQHTVIPPQRTATLIATHADNIDIIDSSR